jgi:hypothetical protein
MAELTIYDSEGSPVAETGARTNERIQDFFFDGVRLSVDTTGQGLEMVAFFRARDSQASRSEQYYAVFQSDSAADISRFGGMVTRRVEGELDKSLETSTDDTEVFRALRSVGGEEVTPPGDPNTRNDLVELVKEGTDVTVGVRTGKQALALIEDVLREQRRVKTAVAERTDGSSLRDYDLVVDVGQYQGLALLGNTEQALEDLRERRRQRLQPDYVEDDDGRDTVALASLGVAVVGGLLLLLYAGCWFAGSLPVVGGLLPGVDCGGAAGPADGAQVTVENTYTANITGADWGNTSANTTTLELRGALTNATAVTNGTNATNVTNGTALAVPGQNVTVSIVSQTGNATDRTKTVTTNGTVTVTFENVTREPVSANLTWEDRNLTARASIDENGTLSNIRPANRTVTKTFNVSTSATGTDTPTNGTATPTTGTGTPTSAPTTTAEPTPTPTPTPTTTAETTQGSVSAVAMAPARSGR